MTSQIKSRSEHRAMSEASGRSRSIMRCETCMFVSVLGRCQRALSPKYSLRVHPENHCEQWERLERDA